MQALTSENEFHVVNADDVQGVICAMNFLGQNGHSQIAMITGMMESLFQVNAGWMHTNVIWNLESFATGRNMLSAAITVGRADAGWRNN
ncbi:MAG: hypothetical protein ACLVD8_27255 [Enterocloster sp.]|uniref:hypothetical protein n=1 Tax=Enterocloster sp. TaxID=2719315 RepID=UPI00399A454A